MFRKIDKGIGRVSAGARYGWRSGLLRSDAHDDAVSISGRNDRFWVGLGEQATATTEADPLRG